MKSTLALLIATIALTPAQATRSSNYKLDYLDLSRNVVSVEIGTNGKPVDHSHKLTSRGGYDGYSVSPDGNRVFAWKLIGWSYRQFPVVKCFLEKQGILQGCIFDRLMADGFPEADWSLNDKYLIIRLDDQVEMRTIIYSLKRCKTVIDTTDLLPGFSGDQAYSFVLEDKGDLDNSPALLRILDMRTGKTSKVAQVNFGSFGEPSQNKWFGSSHRFAFIDTSGNLSAGEAIRGGSRPAVKKWMLTKNGHCTDLRYIQGKGIYFIQKTGTAIYAYYSKDLQTLSKTVALPVEQEKRLAEDKPSDGRVYSPDDLFYATVETVKPSEVGMIRVYDKLGHFSNVAKGRRPTWRGGKAIIWQQVAPIEIESQE